MTFCLTEARPVLLCTPVPIVSPFAALVQPLADKDGV